MPESKKKKGKTLAEKRYYTEVRKHTRIDEQIKFSQETGLCPVCQIRKKGHGMTCGDRACIEGWLMPSQSRFFAESTQTRQSLQQRYHAALRGLENNEGGVLRTLTRLYGEMGMTPPDHDLLLVQAHRDRLKLKKIMPAEASASLAWLQERGHI